MPKISVIVPVYNTERYLEQCLASIADQTLEDIQILVVNDGSTDASGSIIDRFSEKDPRFDVIHIVNSGPSVARNTALRHALGTYIMFVDADDWIEPTTCARVFKWMEQCHSDLLLWSYRLEYKGKSTPVELFDAPSGTWNEEQVAQKLHRRMIGLLDEELGRPQLADSLSTIWCKLYRRSIILQHGIEFMDIRDIGSYEDGVFNLHYLEHVRRADYFNACLYHYRKLAQGSVSNAYRANLPQKWGKLYSYMEDYIVTKFPDRCYEQALANRICLSMLGIGLIELSANNPAGQLARYRNLNAVLSSQRYRDAYRTLNISLMPLSWKVFMFSAKYRWTLLLMGVLYAIKFLRERK